MKKVLKVLSITMIVFLCLVLIPTTIIAKEPVHEPKELLKSPEFQAKNAVNSVLQSNFISQIMESIINEHGVVDRFGKYYPADYAGAFINEEGTLVVCLTTFDSIDKYREYYSNVRILEIEKMIVDVSPSFARLDIDISEYVKYELRPYSFRYLTILQEKLYEKMDEFSITETILDEDENVICVGLRNIEMKESVDNYLREFGIDLRAVKYYEHFGRYEYLANNARIGTEVRDKTTTSGAARGSIGFHAKDNSSGQHGVVTAAHVIDKNVATYNKNGQKIGTSSSTKWGITGRHDFAFIPYSTSDITPTSLIDWFTVPIYGVANPTQGAYIQRYGFVSGFTGEYIKKINVDVTMNGSQLYALFIMGNSTNVLQGDSGGAVITPFAQEIIGIISFIDTRNWDNVYCVGVPYFVVDFNMTVLTGNQYAN